jgi:hypothetical protein
MIRRNLSSRIIQAPIIKSFKNILSINELMQLSFDPADGYQLRKIICNVLRSYEKRFSSLPVH